MISEKRRELFVDLYHLAEYYEAPPFKPGDVTGNSDWFCKAADERLKPFFKKHDSALAMGLVFEIVEDASRRAAEINKMEV